jgi:hypothetical protein
MENKQTNSSGGSRIPAKEILTAFLTLTGILIGVWKYTHSLKVNDTLEFKRNIWTEQQDTYKELGEVTSNMISNLDKPDTFVVHFRDFDRLYYGRMMLVQDDSIELEMIKFREQVTDFLDGKIPIAYQDPSDWLRDAECRLLKQCKKSLERSWTELN